MPPSLSTVPRSRKGRTIEKLHSVASLGNQRFQAFLQHLVHFDTSVSRGSGWPRLGLWTQSLPRACVFEAPLPQQLLPGSHTSQRSQLPEVPVALGVGVP